MDGQPKTFKNPLNAHLDIEIFHGISVDPPLVVFPWDPLKSPSYEIHFHVRIDLLGY